MSKYQNWTKISLSRQDTRDLYECLREVVNRENANLRLLLPLLASSFPDFLPLEHTFDGGRFTTSTSTTIKEIPIAKSSKSDKRHLKRSIQTDPDKSRLNLSVIKVKGILHYRLFVSFRLGSGYTVPILRTDTNILQISDNDFSLKRECPAHKFLSCSYEGKILTYKEYIENINKNSSFWSFSEKEIDPNGISDQVNILNKSNNYIALSILEKLHDLSKKDVMINKQPLSGNPGNTTIVNRCLTIFETSSEIKSVVDTLIDHDSFAQSIDNQSIIN